MTTRIFTVPLDIYRSKDGAFIKHAEAQVKTVSIDTNNLRVVVACQEGIFGVDLSKTKIRRCKSKEDLEDEDWINICFGVLLNNTEGLQRSLETIECRVHLDSSEQYDEKTGELLNEELAEEEPRAELEIGSTGILLVLYGKFELILSNSDGTQQEKDDADLLKWISLQSRHTRKLEQDNEKVRGQVKDLQLVVDCKEREIKETISDYDFIIKELENRYFQVLNSKKKKIFELEGISTKKLDPLNEKFKRDNEHNLNRVTVNEILQGDGFKALEQRQREKRRREETEAELKKARPKRKKIEVKKEEPAKPTVKEEPEEENVKDESDSRVEPENETDYSGESESSENASQKQVREHEGEENAALDSDQRQSDQNDAEESEQEDTDYSE